MATSLKISEKEGGTVHLQFNTYYMVQRLWKSVQQILRYFGSKQTSLVWHKIGRHGNVRWDIEKKFRSIFCTQKAFIWCKNCKKKSHLQKSHLVCVLLTTQNWLTWQRSLRNRKKWTGSRKFTQIPSIWWKDRENRSSSTEISVLKVKKRWRNYGR